MVVDVEGDVLDAAGRRVLLVYAAESRDPAQVELRKRLEAEFPEWAREYGRAPKGAPGDFWAFRASENFVVCSVFAKTGWAVPGRPDAEAVLRAFGKIVNQARAENEREPGRGEWEVRVVAGVFGGPSAADAALSRDAAEFCFRDSPVRLCVYARPRGERP